MPKPAGGPAQVEAPQPRAASMPTAPLPPGLAAAPPPAVGPPPAATPSALAGAAGPGTDRPAQQPEPPQGLRALGTALALFGAAGMAIAVAWPLVTVARGARASAPGDVPAVALVLLLVGFAACFPSLLTDGSGEGYSTMRVAVLAIVCVFCLVAVKAGWAAQGAADVTVSDSWWHILTVALGGKVAQAFAEAWKGGGVAPPSGGGSGHG